MLTVGWASEKATAISVTVRGPFLERVQHGQPGRIRNGLQPAGEGFGAGPGLGAGGIGAHPDDDHAGQVDEESLVGEEGRHDDELAAGFEVGHRPVEQLADIALAAGHLVPVGPSCLELPSDGHGHLHRRPT